MFVLLRTLAAAVVAVVGAAGVNAAAFEVRAAVLQHTWRSAEAEGVPSDLLLPSASALAAARSLRLGPVPYELVSFSVVTDPIAPAEASTTDARLVAMAEARARALNALAEIRTIGGFNYESEYEAGLVAVGAAPSPRRLEELRSGWNREALGIQALRQRLAAASGGITDDVRPADVAAGTVQLLGLQAAAEQSGVWTDPAFNVLVDAQMYLRETLSGMLADHDRIAAEVGAALAALQKRMDAWSGAEQALDSTSRLLPTANRYGDGGNLAAQLTGARQALAAARDDAALLTAAQTATGLLAAAQRAVSGLPPVDPAGCITGAPAKLIVVHLATQQLIAYDGGCPWLRTPVTTGRAALPTDRGTFQIFYKAPIFKMISEWPPGNPFWYPPTYVYWAMEFVGDGTFLHSAAWQPASTYGAGSEYGPYASHGCVHVLPGPLQQLYDWAPIGTTVTVTD